MALNGAMTTRLIEQMTSTCSLPTAVQDIVTSAYLRAQQLVASKDLQGADDRPGQTEEAVDNAPEAQFPPYKDEAVRCLVMTKWRGDCGAVLCHTLDVDRAFVLLNAHFCRNCGQNATARLVEWWWADIRADQPDTLPGECSSGHAL